MSSQPPSKTPTQKRRTRRLRSRKTPNSLTNSLTYATYQNSSTSPPPPPPRPTPTPTSIPRMISTLKTYPPLTSTISTSPTLTYQTSPLTSPSTPPTTTIASSPQSYHLSMSPPLSPTKRYSTTSVDTVENLQDGDIIRNTLSDFDLEVDMLASRAFARDGEESVYPINPPVSVSLSTPRLVIDDYLEDVSLHSDTTSPSPNSSSSSRHSLQRARRLSLSRGTSSIDDHYELVIMPQLEIILDAVRAVQYEVNHLHNELLDLKAGTRHSLKKIWDYLNFSL